MAQPEREQLPGWDRCLQPGDQVQGVILGWQPEGAQVLTVPAAAFAWAGGNPGQLFRRGAAPLFRVEAAGPDGVPTRLELDQEPEVEAALLAVEPQTGAIRAMVGGWDFQRSKFNRALQAERQVGSTMKPFVYGAAFSQGLTPASLVADVPTRFTISRTVYQPRNYERNFRGPMPIWEAVRASRNLPVVRLLESTGIDRVISFGQAAGVKGRLRPFSSLSLGASDLTLKDMVCSYGTKVALPIWVDFMKTALPSTPREAFPAPQGMGWVEMDRATGLLAGSATADADRVRLAFKPGTAPKFPSTPEIVAALRAAGDKAGNQPGEDRSWGAGALTAAALASAP